MKELTAQEKLRKSVTNYNKTHTIKETAVFFEIGTDTVSRWKAQYKNEGTLTPAKKGGATYYVVSEEGKKFLASEVKKKNDMTLEEIRQQYFIQFNEEISVPTVHYHLKK